jgi:hypothetical protein
MWVFLNYPRLPLPNINSKPCLSLDEKKTCVVLTTTLTKYKVNKMARGDY